MNTDSAFWIGSTHAVCQDYVAARASGEAAAVVLSDGCSSSPDTDIGARLLAQSALRLLSDQDAAIRAAAECAGQLGLPPVCLDATLLTIQAENGAFTISCAGDGVVALGHRDGSIDVFVIAFAASYPQYPSYHLDEGRRAQWTAQPGNAKTIQHWTLTEDGAAEVETRCSEDAIEQFSGTAADGYRFAAALSDGVQSFTQCVQTETSRTTVAVPVTAVLAALLAFKGGRGQFVQRRAQAFRKECTKRGWHHSDDVSIGAVWLEE